MTDINRLPIPDWGITCPSCSYPLRGLPEHRCAECGLRFDMADVVKSWHALRSPRYTGRESPLPDYAFSCGSCDEPLVGAVDQLCPACGKAFDTQSAVPARDWFPISLITKGAVDPAALAGELEHEGIPYQWQTGELTPQSLYLGSRPESRELLVRRDFYFDARAFFANFLRRHAALRESSEWECANCAESNPPTFETCWKCSADRPAGAEPRK